MEDSHKNSESKLKTRKPELVALRERQRNRNRAVAALGVLVVLATVMALMVPAISMAHGDLICGMEEHQHSDACYGKVLTCTQEEGESHTHSDACYENRLTCNLPVHTHNDTCYAAPEPEPAANAAPATEPAGEPAVGQQSGSDTGAANQQPDNQPDVLANGDGTDQQPDGQPGAQAGDGAGANVVVGQTTQADNAGANAEFPAQTFEADLVEKDGDKERVVFTVSVEAPDGALPKSATMQLTPVTKESTLEAAKDAAAAQTDIDADRAEAVAVDITFFDQDGVMVEPKADVHVTMSVPAAKDSGKGADAGAPTDLAVVHLPENEAAEVVSTMSADPATATAEFDSADFSVYALVYTVDFHYEVDGKTYEYNIPGGGFVSFYNLVEALGIATDDANTERNEIQDLVDSVESITFSNPALVNVSKVEEDTTVEALKKRLQLECEYSAELTEEQITSINAQPVAAGDWALISLKPFTSEERLTVTMKNGDVWTVKVTDDQNNWHVDINLLDYDGANPASAEELALINGKTYAIVAVVSDLEGNKLGYRVAGAAFPSGQTTTSCNVGLDAFKPLKIDPNDGKPVDAYEQAFVYDPSQHRIEIRLYEGTENVDQYQYKDYRTICALPDYANGFEFLAPPNGNVQDETNRTTTLNMKRAYDKQFNVRLNIDPAGLEIAENDRYYVLVTVDHETTPTTYAYAPVTVSAGDTTINIPVTTWYDQNGNELPNEKFTGNETVNVKLYTTNKDGNGNKIAFNTLNEIKNSQVKVLVSEGDSVNRYNVYYGGMQTPVNDDDEKKTHYFSTIDFHAPSGSISKGDIDRLLDDATDFGYYTEQYIGHSGDIEATIGADYLNTVFESDFAYSSANLNVNRLKVLKIYTDGEGNPVQKQVTIKVKKNGEVVGEKTGTTDADGKLELEFEKLGPGEYDIVEIIDGQEITGQGSASVSGQTINYNFSIDKAHFANNLNVNYFGTIGEDMDLDKLKTMIQKASRVDVVILTDTEADKARIDAAVESQSTGKQIDVVLNGTDPYKKYDIKSDMVRLRQLSDDLAATQSSDTIRVINIKASEISDNGLSFDDDGRYIVLNIEMDRDTFCPYVLLDGKLLEADYGQSGNSNSSKVLFNLRNTTGGRYDGLVNTNKQGAGIILAPDANAHILGGPFGGTIITHQVNRQGNELHSNNPNQIQTLNAVIQNVLGNPTTGILQLSKKFSDNTKDKVTYFTFKVKLQNDDQSKITAKSFPATGLKTGDAVTFDENGEALVQVRAGNSVAIANLPGGTTYTVEEIVTPETAHFQLDHYEGDQGTIEAGKTSNATVYNTTIPLNDGFSARKTVNGKTPTAQQQYDFKLDEYRGGKWTTIQTKQNNGEQIAFDKIEFTEAGTYYYKIYEDAESVTGLMADSTVYLVKVKVEGEAGNLQYNTTYYQVKDNNEAVVSGDGLGSVNESNIELVTTALFDNKDQPGTVDVTILKVDANHAETALGGATFRLTKVLTIESTNQVESGKYDQSGTTSSEEETKGRLEFKGLTPGFYYLEETNPPEGYVKTGSGWHFEVTSEGIVRNTGDSFSDSGSFRYVDAGNITVTNEPGAALPNTGGPGTRLFTILGSILILGAGVLLWRRWRTI